MVEGELELREAMLKSRDPERGYSEKWTEGRLGAGVLEGSILPVSLTRDRGLVEGKSVQKAAMIVEVFSI